MKIAYKHLIDFIPSLPSPEDISEKLFQLGHEHEIENGIFDIELTPNRGDCLSLNGILRDLSVFYKINLSRNIYKSELKEFDFNFVNKAKDACPNICFLKIDIEEYTNDYKDLFNDYFKDLSINKNNFFTDISNYISYETGQPTHCYDAEKLLNKDFLFLEDIICNQEFETLLEKKIFLKNKNLVFTQEGKVINLAGIIGDKNTSCSSKTKSVIVECANFNSEYVIGKSKKYDLNSDAAHKFERGVDPNCHEYVLRRFLNIVEEHAKILNVELFKKSYSNYENKKINLEINSINRILGCSISKDRIEEILTKLNFEVDNEIVVVPSYRNDIKNLNDIAEEIARVIGYNNIDMLPFQISSINKNDDFADDDTFLRKYLARHGFYEVINNPFINEYSHGSIAIDNPLDSTRNFIRTSTKNSLIDNLLYNERRQNDSIKFYEISNLYSFTDEKISNRKVLGIICSGRLGKNYEDFSKKINKKFLIKLLEPILGNVDREIEIIQRDKLNSRSKNQIIYLEVDLDKRNLSGGKIKKDDYKEKVFKKYVPISEYPYSYRDLSYSIKSEKIYHELQDFLFNYSDPILKEVFIFDFYNDELKEEIKIGFRFIFQSTNRTITEKEVNKVIDSIIKKTLVPNEVEIPGLNL